jgi:uncharacterized MAPEG superfamily protein
MTYPFWALFIGVLLPYLTAFTAALYKKKQFGKIDFNTPREQSAELVGAGLRANAAQYNTWEALIVFSIAFFAAVAAGVSPEKFNLPVLVWVIARVLYPICYISNIAIPRVCCFVAGMVASLSLLILALSV